MALIKALCLVSVSLLLFRGVSPQEIYSRAGDDTTLPCDGIELHGPNCSDVNWLLFKTSTTARIHKVSKGKVQDSSSRLNSDCSLSLQNISERDSGLFRCDLHGYAYAYARVHLSVLTVSPAPADSSPNPEHTTLQCSLGIFNGRCRSGSFRWLDQNNTILSGQINNCVSYLTVERQSEQDRTFTCQYLRSSEVKVSVEYRLRGNKNTDQPKDSGVSPQEIYSRAGDDATLLCDRLQHQGPNCSDVNWLLYKRSGTAPIYRVTNGKVQDRSSRLNSDCSLSLQDVTEEDSGSFRCHLHGDTDAFASVFLSVLTVSPAPADSSHNPEDTTLQCSLGTYSGHCGSGSFRWLDQNNTILSGKTKNCVSFLTVERQSEQDRTFTCQYLRSSEVKVSVEYRLRGNKNTDQPKDPEDNVVNRTIPAPRGNCEESQASAGWWWFQVLKTVSWSALISTTVIVSICTRERGKPKRSNGDFAPPADYENL